MDVKLRRSGATAPNTFKWMYSINDVGKPDTDKIFTEISTFNYSIIEDATNGGPQDWVDLSGYATLQNVNESKEITFRLYVWGANATNTSVA